MAAVCRHCCGEVYLATSAVADVAAGEAEDSEAEDSVVAAGDLAAALAVVVTLVAEVREVVGNPYNR